MEKKQLEQGLTVYTINAIGNPLMREQALKMVEAKNGIMVDTWQFAKAVVEVVNKELFMEDFGSQARFAKFAGVSPATISQWKNAVEFQTAHKLEDITASVGHCYEYSRIEKDTKDNNLNMADFAKWLLEETGKKSVYDIPTGSIKANYKKWRAIQLATDEVEVTENGTSEEPTATDNASAKAEMVDITYNGDIYKIPLEVLKKYAVLVK